MERMHLCRAYEKRDRIVVIFFVDFPLPLERESVTKDITFSHLVGFKKKEIVDTGAVFLKECFVLFPCCLWVLPPPHLCLHL